MWNRLLFLMCTAELPSLHCYLLQGGVLSCNSCCSIAIFTADFISVVFSLFQASNAETVKKIHEERMGCVNVKIQIRLLQQQMLSSQAEEQSLIWDCWNWGNIQDSKSLKSLCRLTCRPRNHTYTVCCANVQWLAALLVLFHKCFILCYVLYIIYDCHVVLSI